jgi:predicted kinase
VVLVGATAAGKSHWAHECFEAEQIISSDRLRAAVGTSERDQRASRDAFEVLDLIVEKRLKRRLTTVIDSTGLDTRRRAGWRTLAERSSVPAYAVVFETAAGIARERNRARADPVPSKVVTSQLRELSGAVEALPREGFAAVLRPGAVELVPPRFLTALD